MASFATKLVPTFLAGAVALGASGAAAEVERLGDWPADDPLVSLDVNQRTRSDALEELAQASGWSLVFRGEGGVPIDVHVSEQPASRVLELLLEDGHWVAKREGTLVSIGAKDGASPPLASAVASAAASAPAAASASERAEIRHGDVSVTGRRATIGAGEEVDDLSVAGGEADVLGRVRGDASVVGGKLTLRQGARIDGDVSVMGGELVLEDGSRVDGEVNVLGGDVKRAPGARVDGGVTGIGASDDDEDDDDTTTTPKEGSDMMNLIDDAGSAISSTAMLFVFGAVLLALAARRMEALQVEVAARPMRSFALGIVGLIGALATFIALCITIVGIPIAILGLLLGLLACYGGVAAVLTTVGGMLVRHRTENIYLHLAAGCALYLVIGAIPYLGSIATFAVIACGVGTLVATRGAGFIKPRNGAGGPYRAAAV